MNTDVNRRSLIWLPLALVGIIVASFVCYRTASDIYFVADDFLWLERAMYFKDILSIFKVERLYFDPLVYLIFRVNYLLGGLDPAWYHHADLLIHIINALLVFYLALLLTQNKFTAFFSGLFFAISPTNADSVLWPSSRVDTLAAIFYLSSISMYIHYQKTGKLKNYSISIILFIVSLSSKSTPIILPLIISILEVASRNKALKSLFWRLAPFFVVAIVYLILLRYNTPHEMFQSSINIKELIRGIAVLFFPESLIADREKLYLILSLVIFVLIGVSGFFCIRARYFPALLLMVVAIILPLSFIPASFVYATPSTPPYYLLGSICHRLYFAVIGFSILIGTVVSLPLEKVAKNVRYYFQGFLIICVFIYGYTYIKEREQLWHSHSKYYEVFLAYIKGTEGHTEVSGISDLYLLGPPCINFMQSAYRVYLNNENLFIECSSDLSKLPDIRHSTPSTAIWVLRYDWKFINIREEVQKYQELLVTCRNIADQKERKNCLMISEECEKNLRTMIVTSKRIAERIKYLATTNK